MRRRGMGGGSDVGTDDVTGKPLPPTLPQTADNSTEITFIW